MPRRFVRSHHGCSFLVPLGDRGVLPGTLCKGTPGRRTPFMPASMALLLFLLPLVTSRLEG